MRLRASAAPVGSSVLEHASCVTLEPAFELGEVVLFLAGWAILSAVLVVVFDVADVGDRFWVLVGIALAIFSAWVVLRTWLSRKLGR
jgi:hypothetical protein